VDALNPQSTAANTWFGMTPGDLDFMNSFQSPGFGPGGGPSPGDWEGFLNALNPGADAANTWFGMTPEELDFMNSAPEQNAPSSDWAQYEADYWNQLLEGGGDVSTPADTYGYDQGYGDYYDMGP